MSFCQEINHDLVYIFEKISQVQRIMMWNMGKVEGLTPTQMSLLEFFSHHTSTKPTMSDVASEYDLTQATVSESISSLIKKGFLEKFQDEKDKRRYTIALTREGKKKYDRVRKWKDEFSSQLNNIAMSDRIELRRIMSKLVSQFNQKDYISIFRLCENCSNYEVVNGVSICNISGAVFEDGYMTYDCENYQATE